jgi:hypothetical protein
VKLSVSAIPNRETPGLRVRVHRSKAGNLPQTRSASSPAGFVDVSFDGKLTASVTI